MASFIGTIPDPESGSTSYAYDTLNRLQKRFDVRFFGMTFREDLKNVSFSWRCKKNDGIDPAFTCDEQKVIKWDEKK